MCDTGGRAVQPSDRQASMRAWGAKNRQRTRNEAPPKIFHVLKKLRPRRWQTYNENDAFWRDFGPG